MKGECETLVIRKTRMKKIPVTRKGLSYDFNIKTLFLNLKLNFFEQVAV